jgi:hypothetical protein
VFVNAADDRIDPIGDEEDDECSLDGDLLQKSFHDTHAEEIYQCLGSRKSNSTS